MLAILLLVADLEPAVLYDIHAEPPAVLVLDRARRPRLRYDLKAIAAWRGEARTRLKHRASRQEAPGAGRANRDLTVAQAVAAELERDDAADRDVRSPQS